MTKIQKTGALVSIEVTPQTVNRATVIARLVSTGDTLRIDQLNVASEKDRATFANALGEHASAALVLLHQAAVQLTSSNDPTEEGALSGQSMLATWSTDVWSEAVDGDQLLTDIAALIRRYVVMDESAVTLVALWIIHTHAMDATDCSPILALLSPAMRSGKTSLLQILELLVRDGVSVTNLTPAGLFRTIEQGRPTLLIDEADTFLEKNHELIGLLNKGHTRVGAFTIRNEKQGDSFVPRRFSLWSAKAIAAIGRIPATLLDRSIISPMRRRGPSETVDRLRSDRLEEFHIQRAKGARWAADHLEALRLSDPIIPPDLNSRAADSWRPLIAIADEAGGAWPARAVAAALSLRTRESDLVTVDIQLLSDVREVFAANPTVSYLPTKMLLLLLVALDGSPWGEINYGKALTEVGFAKLLHPYGIRSAKKRIPGTKKTLWVYHKSEFVRAWDQYLPPTEHPEHAEPGAADVPGVPDIDEPPTGPSSGSDQ